MEITLVLSTLQTVISVALIVLIGFVGTKAGVLGKGTLKELSVYLIYIAVPCTIISRLQALNGIGEAIYGVAITSAAQIICVVLGYCAAVLLRLPKDIRGVNAASFGICNSGFIGLPIVAMLFGEGAKNVAIYFIISNNLVFWTLGAYLIKKDAEYTGTLKSEPKPDIRQRIKGINPPIAVFVVMLVITGMKIPLPKFFMSAVEIVDETTAPAALIFCGTVLGGIGFKQIKWQKGFSLIMLGRYLVSPLVMVALFILFPGGELLGKVLVIQSAMPVVTLVEVGANKYGGNVEYASLSFIYSLFIFAFTLPVTYYLLMAAG